MEEINFQLMILALKMKSLESFESSEWIVLYGIYWVKAWPFSNSNN